MKNWVIEEFQNIDLKDERLNKRSKIILNKLSNKPYESIPKAFSGFHETTAAYRFLNNDNVNYDNVLSAHRDATLKRLNNEEVILAIQDTTSIDYTFKKIGSELGHLENSKRSGYLLHPTLLTNDKGLCLGICKSKLWTRNPKEIGAAKLRKKMPINKKESYRWIESYNYSCELANMLPEKKIINIADRESDIYELFYEANKEKNNAHLVVRAGYNRRTLNENKEVTLLRDRLEKMPPKGKIKVSIPRTSTRKKRISEFTVKYENVEFLVPANKVKDFSNIKINVITFKEETKDAEIKPIEWILITTLDIQNMEAAVKLLGYYKARWQIEIFFRTLKTGCKIEELQLEKKERLEPCLALYMIIAWRIMYITMIGRVYPNLPADQVFETEEIEIISIIANKKSPSEKLTVKALIRIIASFGGFLGRKSDGEPGPEQIWTGLKRVSDFVLTYKRLKEFNTYV